MDASEKPDVALEAVPRRADDLATPQELRDQKSRKERRAETQRKYLAKKRQRVQVLSRVETPRVSEAEGAGDEGEEETRRADGERGGSPP
eukprot:scaffold556_cov221-Pinguiococcus_pyrenoidosus.AAC.16